MKIYFLLSNPIKMYIMRQQNLEQLSSVTEIFETSVTERIQSKEAFTVVHFLRCEKFPGEFCFI